MLNSLVEWLADKIFLLIVLFSVPFVVLAAWKKIYPHLPLLVLTLIPFAMAPLLLFWPELLLVIVIVDGVILAVALFDLWSLPPIQAFECLRKHTQTGSLGGTHQVTLEINNVSQRSYSADIRDDVPPDFKAQPEEFHLVLEERSRASMHYELEPTHRGAFQLEHVYLQAHSRFKLWRRYLTYPTSTTLNVYPDMHQLAEYAVLARANRLSLMGVRRTRRIGQDNEFERLRDYTLDDNYKHIDWRTTARRNKLTVKDFQTNQSQRLIFLLDCGRMMTNEASGLSLLDHSLNAALMLSFVALRQGDSVGLVCFSDQIHTYVPPRSGMNQMNRLLHAGFDRFPSLVESRYDDAFLYLDSHCKKRSLVILITNVIDEVNSQQIQRYLTNLVGRHLPLGVLLRDHQLFDAADQPYKTEAQMYRAAAAAEIATWRHQVLTDLQHQGVLALDVLPEEMTAPLVNQYLDIKARHLL